MDKTGPCFGDGYGIGLESAAYLPIHCYDELGTASASANAHCVPLAMAAGGRPMSLEDALSALAIDDAPSERSPVNVLWETSLATDAASEAALLKALAPFSEPKSMRKLAWSLPSAAKAQIERLAVQHGFTARQAYSFRRGMLKCIMGMKPFMSLGGNDDAKMRLIAESFERCIESYLREHIPPDVVVTTEAQRKQRAVDAGVQSGPTPDLTFDPPVHINGVEVAWVDAKMMYASYTFRKKNFMPEKRFAAIADKYSSAFGPGVFVIASGFCRALEAEVPALFLDSTPLDMTRINAVIESDQGVEAMTLEALSTALGMSTDPPVVAVPDVAQEPPLVAAPPDSSLAQAAHVWDPQIRCGASGIHTIHYHICTRCGARGLRRKVSNKKCAIVPSVANCAPATP